MDGRLSEALFIRRTGWTWQEYRSQPEWLIDILKIMEGADLAEYHSQTKTAEELARKPR